MIYVLQSLCLHSSLSNEIELMKFRNSKNFDLGLWGLIPEEILVKCLKYHISGKDPQTFLLVGSLILWHLLLTSPSYIWEGISENENSENFLVWFFQRESSSKLKQKEKLEKSNISRIESDRIICSPLSFDLYLCLPNQMEFTNIKNDKIFPFFCLTFPSEKIWQKFRIIFSQERTLKQPC